MSTAPCSTRTFIFDRDYIYCIVAANGRGQRRRRWPPSREAPSRIFVSVSTCPNHPSNHSCAFCRDQEQQRVFPRRSESCLCTLSFFQCLDTFAGTLAFLQKRQKRSFTPTSHDDDVVPVAHDEDTETPTPENAPLIRQAVGFSWTPSINADVCTYQATVAPRPVVPYFLPGQAPPPPKPKPSKPRAHRRKKGEQYSDHTSKFKLSDSSPDSGSSINPTSAGNSTGTSSSSAVHPPVPSRPMIPAASYTFRHVDGSATAERSNTNGVVSATSSHSVKRARKSSKRKVPASVDDSFSQPSARPRPSVIPQYPNHRGPSVERPEQVPDPQTHVGPGGTSVGHTNGCKSHRFQYDVVLLDSATTVTQGLAQRLRMVTLLIEDLRSGVPDSQLAEVKVPLRVADDPEDGFWADAVEICNALQGGPSRIDG